jgi:hypothetical protein
MTLRRKIPESFIFSPFSPFLRYSTLNDTIPLTYEYLVMFFTPSPVKMDKSISNFSSKS